MPDFTFKPTFPIADVINAAQRKAQLDIENQQQGNKSLIEGLQSIGQVGQGLVDKRLQVAQALALGKQFGIPEDQARLMTPEQVTHVGNIKKSNVDMRSLLLSMHPEMASNPTFMASFGSGASSGAAAPVTPVSTPTAQPSNGAMLTSNVTATPVAPPAAPAPLAQPTTGQAPVPIQAPPLMPKTVNKATADTMTKMYLANKPTDVFQYTQGKGLEKVGQTGKGDKVITSQMNPGLTASWETATPQQQALAKAMYEGRVRPSDLSFRERGVTTTLANEYANMNGLAPFKAYNADVNATMAKFATSGKLGQNALSLNTALGHAASAFDSYQNIQNTNQQWLNKPINWLKKNTNDPNVVALGINLNALQGELANVFKNSGATDQEISHWRDYLNGDLTPAQYIGALGKVDELLKSRLSAMEYQQSQAGGGGQLISPHAQQISDKLSNPTKNTNTPGWDQGSEQRLQMLLEKKAKGTLKS